MPLTPENRVCVSWLNRTLLAEVRHTNFHPCLRTGRVDGAKEVFVYWPDTSPRDTPAGAWGFLFIVLITPDKPFLELDNVTPGGSF
jgi:hypothetical protein